MAHFKGSKFAIFIAAIASVWCPHANAADRTYRLIPLVVLDRTDPFPFFGFHIVTGSITTNGTITSAAKQYLSTSDILDWNFSLTINNMPPISFSNKSRSTDLGVVGTALTASTSSLSFDFSKIDSEIYFEQPGALPPYPDFNQLYFRGPQTSDGTGPIIDYHWCFAASSCYGGPGQERFAEVGTIGIATRKGVPELSTWAMVLLGFAGFVFAGYRRARVGTPHSAA